MKVLVTGASGYLGGRICHAFTKEGHSIRALVRKTSLLDHLPKNVDIEIVYGDVTDFQSVLEACNGCDALVHTAALVEPWLPDPSKFITVNVGGLKNVLEAVKQTSSIQKLIYTSSFFALGPTDGHIADERQGQKCCKKPRETHLVLGSQRVSVGKERPPLQHPGLGWKGIDFEAERPAGDELQQCILGCVSLYIIFREQGLIHSRKFYCTEYEKSKVLADEIACQAASEGLPVVLLYPGVIYGPGKLTAGNVLASIMLERFNGRLPGYIGHGNDRVSFSHVEDVAYGHVAALEKGRVGERYLLTGENASFVDAFNLAANLTGTAPPSFHIPLWVLEIYGWLSVFGARITRKLPLISYPTVYVLKHQWAYSCEKAKEELGYKPRTLREGLADMLSWLKNMDLIKY